MVFGHNQFDFKKNWFPIIYNFSYTWHFRIFRKKNKLRMKVDKKIKSQRSNWRFDKNVAENFDVHVLKSVPFYKISHDLSLKISEFFLKEKSICYVLI